MKTHLTTALLVSVLLLGRGRAAAAPLPDPTVPPAELADALKANLAEARGAKIWALAVGAGGEGVALVGREAKDAALIRRGSRLSETVDGVPVTAEVRSVTPAGVELCGSASRKILLPGSFTPLAAPTNAVPELVRHLESEKVPVGRLVRLVADQTGVNISASDRAAEKTVSIFLRNVTADAAVEEICRTTGLWFRRDPAAGVIRVTTMEEYAENLSSFREETTKTFTLLYPNVIEIASVIYGIYPERTLVSLGEEDFLEDAEHDLSRRFQRFRVLEENGNSQFMDMQAPQATSSGSRTGGEDFSFSRGNALSRLTQWDQVRDRQRIGGRGRGRYLSAEALLSAADAKRLEAARAAGDTNAYESVYGACAPAKANIFVSMSRKNNVLIVRTSDVKVMDEITRLVKELDVPTPMVLMELRVLELQLDDNFDAKFEWMFNAPGSTVSARDNVAIAGSAAQSAIEAADPTFAFVAASKHVVSKIELMAQDGKVKQLQTPTLLVANNEVSRIFSGEERPLVTGWTAGNTTISDGVVNRSQTIPEIERKDVGDMLLITPNINADRTVTLHLLHENSSVAGKADIEVYSTGSSDSEDSDDSDAAAASRRIDYVQSRSVTGTFVAKDGMTVLAGGLVTEKEEEQYYRTPVMGSLPLIGWCFRGTEKVKHRKEMIILITPHIIRTPVEGGKISAELMKVLSDHPAADGRGNMGTFRRGEDPTAKEHTLRDDINALVR